MTSRPREPLHRRLDGSWRASLVMALLFAGCGGARVHRESAPPPVSPAEAVARFVAGEVALAAGDTVTAEQHFALAVDADPTDPLLRLRHAQVLRLAGRLDDALAECDAAERIGAPALAVALHRSSIYRDREDLDRALETLDWAFRDHVAGATEDSGEPRDLEALVRFFDGWCDLARESGDADAWLLAAGSYASALPDRAQGWRQLAGAHVSADRLSDAIDAMARAVALADATGRDFELLAEYRWRTDDAAGAVETARACVERFHESLPCRVALVGYLDGPPGERAGSELEAPTREAIADLAAMVSGSPQMLDTAGSELLATTRAEVVAALCSEVASLRPRNAGILARTAWLAARAGLDDLAIDVMQRLLQVDRMNVDALNFVGYEWADRGVNLEQAEVYLREALSLRPGDPSIMDSLAWALFRQGRHAEALDIQLVAVASGEPNAVLLDHLGDMHFALGQIREAIDAWQRALEIAGDDDEDVLDSAPSKIQNALPLLAPTETP